MKKIIVFLLLSTMAITSAMASPWEDEPKWWEFWKPEKELYEGDTYKPERLREKSFEDEQFFRKKINPHAEKSEHPIPIDGGFMVMFAFIFTWMAYKLSIRGYLEEYRFFRIAKTEAWLYAGVMGVPVLILLLPAELSEQSWNLNWLLIPWALIVLTLRLAKMRKMKKPLWKVFGIVFASILTAWLWKYEPSLEGLIVYCAISFIFIYAVYLLEDKKQRRAEARAEYNWAVEHIGFMDPKAVT